MIRVYLFNYIQYLVNWTKYHWRTLDRITFYQILLLPFSFIWDEWVVWRDAAITRANVTGETMSLEWYLNFLFNGGGIDIYIETAGSGGIPLGLEALGGAEAALFETEGLEALGGAEAAAFVVYPLYGEDLLTGTASFAVYVPNALIAFNDQIKGVVNNYRYAGNTFVIINY